MPRDATARPPRPLRPPTLRLERQLCREGHRYVVGVDEVGRGAWAGPLVVGAVVVDAGVRAAPKGVADSKLLSPASRERLGPKVTTWCVEWALGLSPPEEIDALGLGVALVLAARRALGALRTAPTAAIVDGGYDFVATAHDELARVHVPGCALPLSVRAVPRADARCASVAAASILAKVDRDHQMARLSLAHPGFGFEENKGYGTPEHRAAVARLGTCEQHRRSWSFAQPPTGPQEAATFATVPQG